MSAPTVVDLVFNVLGSAIPQDHGYALYAASRAGRDRFRDAERR